MKLEAKIPKYEEIDECLLNHSYVPFDGESVCTVASCTRPVVSCGDMNKTDVCPLVSAGVCFTLMKNYRGYCQED